MAPSTLPDLPADLVSIVIPCFNSERWIGEAIESALAQTWSNTEVIIVDDGSTDSSRKAIERFGDRVRAEFGPNRGGCAARNQGAALARGEWIQFLDADDVLVPDCVERKLRAPRERGIVPCCAIEFMPFKSTNGEHAGPACWREPAHDLDLILGSGAPQTSAPLHRRDDFERVGGFRENLRHAQEFDLHLRMAAILGLRFKSNGHVGVMIRPHSGSLSRSAGHKMHIARGEVLLHGAGILKQQGLLTPERRSQIAQRVTLYARLAAQQGAISEGAKLVHGARTLSPGWYQRAYKNKIGALIVRSGGFSLFERIYASIKGRPTIAIGHEG